MKHIIIFSLLLISQLALAQPMPSASYSKPNDSALKEKLSPLQYAVTQKAETEEPFKNEYWNNHRDGIYVDIVTGEPLFSSLDKYDSGTGWPSFTKPIQDINLNTESDNSLPWQTRTEVRSPSGNSHLGHVFKDGPGPDGNRFCINSASLRFVPLEELESQGYGQYKKLFVKENGGMDKLVSQTQKAVLAGGCFWGMEEIIRKIPGVLETRVGYTGGKTDKPTYEQVSSGSTGHAESVEIVFDPSKLSYKDLLGYFFRMHDPTTKNRQGNDVGTQYRSAIFVFNDEQRKIAEEVKKSEATTGRWKSEIVTEIVDAGTFTAAEDYHQDYLQHNPGGYTCHYLRD